MTPPQKDEMNEIKGPCIVCGRKNYPLSCGGPTICPSCDCGINPEITRLKEELASERAKAEKLIEAAKTARDMIESWIKTTKGTTEVVTQ